MSFCSNGYKLHSGHLVQGHVSYSSFFRYLPHWNLSVCESWVSVIQCASPKRLDHFGRIFSLVSHFLTFDIVFMAFDI